MIPHEWLPELIPYDQSTPWPPYEDLIFTHFCTDFVSNCPKIGSQRLGIESKPEVNGKHRTFWHLISDGEPEPERTICYNRCARIRWPRSMVVSAGGGNKDGLRAWRNTRGTRENLVIATGDFGYVVVLAKRRGYLFLWSAYCVEEDNRRKKLQAECEKYEAEKHRR